MQALVVSAETLVGGQAINEGESQTVTYQLPTATLCIFFFQLGRRTP